MSRKNDWLGGGDFVTALAFVFPLLLAYEVGVVFSDTLNGVDFLTQALTSLVGGDRMLYLLVHAGLAAIYLTTVLVIRHKRQLDFGSFLPMILESAIYALTLGSLILFVMQDLLGLDRLLAIECGLGKLGNALVTSLGAGVHEELIFRLGLFGGGSVALYKLGVSREISLIAAALASSVLFSAAHHIGPLGDPLEMGVFVYRLFAGLVFAAIFYFRSFAHAVYTHFLYDVYVLVIRS